VQGLYAHERFAHQQPGKMHYAQVQLGWNALNVDAGTAQKGFGGTAHCHRSDRPSPHARIGAAGP